MNDQPPQGFEKLPDAIDATEEIVSHPTKRWWLWMTDAATIFTRGVFAGLFPAVAGGVTGIAFTDTISAEAIAYNGALGFLLGLVVKGLERFHNWQAKPENEMPNPFRK